MKPLELVIPSVPLTVLCLCVNAELCGRSKAGRVKGSDSDAVVPLFDLQGRHRPCDVLNQCVLRTLPPRRPAAHLVSKATTSSLTEVRLLQRDETFRIYTTVISHQTVRAGS